MGYIRSFLEIGLNDVGLVGGKTASLGALEGLALENLLLAPVVVLRGLAIAGAGCMLVALAALAGGLRSPWPGTAMP